MVRTLNLGILAHVDAGKTSLTERLLYNAGVIDKIGSVDAGNTQTDSLALERQRGITIKSAVVSFVVGDVTINLIDTPGHPDFIAEVERVLNVLDGAVLVISAVEGVQSQTRVLMRTLQRLRIPTLLFVNKIDRAGAQYEATLEAIADKLTPAIVSMGLPTGLGSRDATFAPFGASDTNFTLRLEDLLAEHNEAFLAAYVAGDQNAASYNHLRSELAAQTKQSLVYPVFFGSAITGAGVDTLTAGITDLLPAEEGDPDAPIAGTVFKIERGPAGEMIAYVRMFSGTVRARDRLQFGADERKVTAISVFDRGSVVQRPCVSAGEIGKLWGLGDVQIGDSIGPPRTATEHHFAPPTLESVIVPRRSADKGALHAALAQLAEQDPLINLRQDDARQEMFVSLYGEVQKEVIQATLASDYGLEVEFRETTTICIERVVGTGAGLDLAPYPFIATIGLRVNPAPANSGVEMRLEIPYGYLPVSYHQAVEDTVRETLTQGLYGWQVTDCIVTMTHAIRLRDWGPLSTAAEHRKLTPLVLMKALRRAGTVVCEPIHRFHLEVPVDAFAMTAPVLAQLRAVPQTQETRGDTYVIEGEIPASRVHELQQQLPGISRGEGLLESAFERYEPVSGEPPTRARTDHNPLNRKEYLLHVQRRV